MTTSELIRVLRGTDFSDGCPCSAEALCKDADCIIIQAADRLEELEERVAIMSANVKPCEDCQEFVCDGCPVVGEIQIQEETRCQTDGK